MHGPQLHWFIPCSWGLTVFCKARAMVQSASSCEMTFATDERRKCEVLQISLATRCCATSNNMVCFLLTATSTHMERENQWRPSVENALKTNNTYISTIPLDPFCWSFYFLGCHFGVVIDNNMLDFWFIVGDGGLTLLNDMIPTYIVLHSSTFRRLPLRWSKLMLLPFGTCHQNFVKTERLNDWQDSPKLIRHSILMIISYDINIFQCACPILFVWSIQIYSLTHALLKPKPGGFACIEAHRFGIGICFCGAPCLPQSPNHVYCIIMNPYCLIMGKACALSYSICVCIYVYIYLLHIAIPRLQLVVSIHISAASEALIEKLSLNSNLLFLSSFSAESLCKLCCRI